MLVAAALTGSLGVPAQGLPLAPPDQPRQASQPSGAGQPGQPSGSNPPSRLDQLTAELARADARLDALAARVEAGMERANRARVDAETADRNAQIAQLVAHRDAEQAREAAARADGQQARIDRFAANAYRRGRAMTPFAAFAGADTPRQALARAEMLEAVSATEGQTLQHLQRARQDQAAREESARQALQVVRAQRDTAARARSATRSEAAAAVREQAAQQGRITELEAQRDQVQRELQQAQARAEAEAARQRAAAEAQRRAAERHALAARKRQPAPRPAEPAREPARPAKPTSSPRDDRVEAVIQRALSQVGSEYAWGGGDSSGPTSGIRDGGVADAHGDFAKVGFDCSGLMVYAFAAAGVSLDHYSGYQYEAGRQVPVSQAQRGDMLFWQSDGSTHHVALYLGGGRMVEAPYSGSEVRVTAVRHNGLAPSAVRLF